MTIPRRITQFLDFHDIDFEAIPRADTPAQAPAACAVAVRPRNVARAVVVRTEDSFYMVVVPQDKSVEIDGIRQALQLPHCRLAKPSELAGMFPDCERDAVPALGNLYNVPVVVDDAFGKGENICVSGGTREDWLLMRYCDFAELTQARVVSIHR